MRKFRLTASALWLAFKCLGSVLLECVGETCEAAEHGIAVHAFLRSVNRVGRDAALLEIDDADIRAVCAAIDLERLPVDPAAYLAEVSFAWNPKTGIARVLGRDLGRDYSTADDDDVVGTADEVGLLPDVVLVPDYKTGHKYLPHPTKDHQMRALGMMAARAYGKSGAVVEIIRLREDGSAYHIAGELDSFDLAEEAEDIRELHALATRYAESGERPPLNVGPHCNRCNAVRYCPAQQAVVVAFTAKAGPTLDDRERFVREFEEGLTPETMLEAYGKLTAVDIYSKLAWEVMERVAAKWPLKFDDGRVYGPTRTKRDELRGEVVYQVLEAMYGKELAALAVEFVSHKTGKVSVDVVARKVAKDGGRKISHVNKEILTAVRDRGGVIERWKIGVREHTPKLLEAGAEEVES